MSTKSQGAPFTPRRRQTVAEEALDANALELFARIAQAGSFAQAARDLGLTRAAISRRIASIEAAVGLALFARSTRSLGLTEAGRRLHARARAVRDAAEGARLALRQARDQLDGTLRISSTASFGRHVLAPLLARFQLLHPAVRYELFFTDRRDDFLCAGLAVAVMGTNQPPETWVAQEILRFSVRAYGRPGVHTLSGPSDLAALPMLLLGQGDDGYRSRWRDESGREEEVDLQASAWGTDLDALLALAQAGGGIAVAPDYCVMPDLNPVLEDVLPGWRLQMGFDVVHALTLPLPAGSETARSLVRFVN